MYLRYRIIIGLLLSGAPVYSAGAKPASAAGAYSTGSLRSMARIYMASGGYEQARPLLESALELAKGADTPDSEMCACVLDLAYLYKGQGRLDEAERMCRRGLELQERLNGPGHPNVAHTLRILSEIYQGQVRYRQAADSLERAIEIMRKVGGEDGVEIAPFQVDMARLLVIQGHLGRAEALFVEAMAAIESGYGADHAYTAKVLASMATLYERQGRYDLAEQTASKALAVLERVYGASHPFLVPVWLVTSKARQARGELAEAKALLEKSMAVISSRSDCGRLAECDVLIRLGEFHILCEDCGRAEPVLEEAIAILQSSQDAKSDRMAMLLNSMARVRMNQGRQDSAQRLCRRALDILGGIFDESHPDIADVLETLAESYRLDGDDAEAVKLDKRVEQMRAQQRFAYAPSGVAI